MTDEQLWNDERILDEIENGPHTPAWLDDDLTPSQLMAIEQGGCASGAYMPAVTYHQAVETMSQHGDEILQYIEDTTGELPKPKDDESWSGIAVHYLSIAVELWVSEALAVLRALDEESDED